MLFLESRKNGSNRKSIISSIVLFFFVFGFVSVALLSRSVNAQNFAVDVTPIKNKINTLDTAVFNVTFFNDNVGDTILFVPLNDPKWLITSKPTYAYLTGLSLGANRNRSILLYAKPNILYPSTYSFIMNFKSKLTGEKLSVPFKVTIIPFKPSKQDYDNYIKMDIDAPTLIDPRNNSELYIYLENRMPLPFNGMKLKIKSAVLKEDKMISLSGNDKKVLSFYINLSKRAEPINDMFIITLSTPDGEVVKEFNKPYAIKAYSDFQEELSVKSSLLKKIITIRVRNAGNVEDTKIVEYKINSFSALFTKTEPEAFYKVENRQKYLVWKLALKPNEFKEVKIYEDYTSLFLFVLFLCVLYFIYYYFLRNPIVIKKRATVVKLKEGGISELKVFIHVRNRGPRVVTKVVLLDKLPKIAEIEKTIKAGTLKPTKIIKHSVKGTIIKWELGTLERFEERIINYNVKSKLSILGWFKLPAAAVKYTYKDKEFVMKSNDVRLEVPKPEE